MNRKAFHLGALSAGIAAMTASDAADAMTAYRWKNRPLVVFAGSDGESRFQGQQSLLSTREPGLRDRDIVVVTVIGDRVTSRFGPEPGMSAAQLRRRYGVGKSEFKAVLVGKDGGVKLQSSSPLSTDRLFATIDSMPMRRQEMRRGRGA